MQVQNHILFLENNFEDKLLKDIYLDETKRIVLWNGIYGNKPLNLDLCFSGGQRKEGCLSITLLYDNSIELYQIMFWIGMDKYDKDKNAIYVGAIQGIQNGSILIKELTKYFYGYRTKNLIFYGLRCFAQNIGIEKIYAVGNEGYYAMNHMRLDRKLKTDFGAFWTECGGVRCDDKRFYVIPVDEYRKSMSELKPSKRAQHRKRYEKLDEINMSINDHLKAYKL